MCLNACGFFLLLFSPVCSAGSFQSSSTRAGNPRTTNRHPAPRRLATAARLRAPHPPPLLPPPQHQIPIHNLSSHTNMTKLTKLTKRTFACSIVGVRRHIYLRGRRCFLFFACLRCNLLARCRRKNVRVRRKNNNNHTTCNAHVPWQRPARDPKCARWQCGACVRVAFSFGPIALRSGLAQTRSRRRVV